MCVDCRRFDVVVRFAICAVACAITLRASQAFACGVSGPDHVWSCSLEEHEEEERTRWFVGAAGVYTSTALRFDNDVRADQSRDVVVGTAAYALSLRLMLQMSAGVAFAGELRSGSRVYEFAPGPSLAAGISYQLIDDEVFVKLSGVLSGSYARTKLRDGDERANYGALDLRVGVTVGTTLFDMLTPYAVARAFGGPAFWNYRGEPTVGTDVSHVQLGAGLALLIATRLDVFVEGIPLGEQAIAVGLTLAL